MADERIPLGQLGTDLAPPRPPSPSYVETVEPFVVVRPFRDAVGQPWPGFVGFALLLGSLAFFVAMCALFMAAIAVG